MDNLNDHFFNVYENDHNMEYYDENPSENHVIVYQTFFSSCTNCAIPIIGKTLLTIGCFFAWALIYRILHDRVSKWWSHIICCGCGLGTLLTNNGITLFTHVIFLGISSFTLLKWLHYFKNHYKGYIMSIFCFFYLLLCEFLLQDQSWRQISGTQMILVMKTISIAFDVDKLAIELPSVVEYFGYIYSVSNILFGPWIPFQEYLKVNVILNGTSIVKIIKHVVISLSCLSVSSCFGYWFIPDDYRESLLVYRDAFLFRASHYFVCHLSRGISMAAGYDYTDVVHISSIEFPKSIVQVVVQWNIPMHKWLKHYVFRPCQHLGKFGAIFSVYIASAALHGFSGALALVLLSLGFYTYVEYMLRYKISQALNCCSLASPCKDNCGHTHGTRSVLAIVINLCFMGMAVLHLAYLGVIFEDISLARVSSPLSHTITTWAEVGFISHIIVFVQYFTYLII